MIYAFGKQINSISYYKHFLFLHVNTGKCEAICPQRDFIFHAKPQYLLHDQKNWQLSPPDDSY